MIKIIRLHQKGLTFLRGKRSKWIPLFGCKRACRSNVLYFFRMKPTILIRLSLNYRQEMAKSSIYFKIFLFLFYTLGIPIHVTKY